MKLKHFIEQEGIIDGKGKDGKIYRNIKIHKIKNNGKRSLALGILTGSEMAIVIKTCKDITELKNDIFKKCLNQSAFNYVPLFLNSNGETAQIDYTWFPRPN